MTPLYTSLAHLKIARNNGALPPMTDVPLTALDVIDPRFTIGLGALYEDERGVRCPLRKCGRFFHSLTPHVNSAHPEIGADGLKTLLEIAPSSKLESKPRRETRAASLAARSEEVASVLSRARAARRTDARTVRATGRKVSEGKRGLFKLAGLRNFRRRCENQIRHDLIDLQNKIGRSPSLSDAETEMGAAYTRHIERVYGTWNAAKATFGLAQHKRHGRVEVTRDAVLESLAAYYAAHGSLPSVKQSMRPDRTPLIPATRTICKAMGTGSWPEAMRRVAALLNIYGGRYGLPPRKEVA
jgi:hypothetical protein